MIPVALLFSGALARKLVRGRPGWHRRDFYFGVQAALAALTSALVYVSDLTRLLSFGGPAGGQAGRRLGVAAGFIAVTFFLLLWLLSIHQDWEQRDSDRGGQIVWLVVISNLVGLLLVSIFVLLVKGT